MSNVVPLRLGMFVMPIHDPVSKAIFALYRDFPDPGRRRGEERF